MNKLSCWPCITVISCKNFLMYCRFLVISVPLFSFAHFFKHTLLGDDMVFVGKAIPFERERKREFETMFSDLCCWVLSKRIVEHKQAFLLWLKQCQNSLLGIILMEIIFFKWKLDGRNTLWFLKILHDILLFCYFLLIICTGNLTAMNS